MAGSKRGFSEFNEPLYDSFFTQEHLGAVSYGQTNVNNSEVLASPHHGRAIPEGDHEDLTSHISDINPGILGLAPGQDVSGEIIPETYNFPGPAVEGSHVLPSTLPATMGMAVSSAPRLQDEPGTNSNVEPPPKRRRGRPPKKDARKDTGADHHEDSPHTDEGGDKGSKRTRQACDRCRVSSYLFLFVHNTNH